MSWFFSPAKKQEEEFLPSIPFDQAVLCEDCRRITASKYSRCTSCGSVAIWSLSRVLEAESVDAAVEKILRLSL